MESKPDRLGGDDIPEEPMAKAADTSLDIDDAEPKEIDDEVVGGFKPGGKTMSPVRAGAKSGGTDDGDGVMVPFEDGVVVESGGDRMEGDADDVGSGDEEELEIHPEVLAAAKKIQTRYRIKMARRRILETVRNQYELVFDPESGEYFYFNAKTGESQWTKPKVLKDHEMYADDASANEAAKKIQNLFRRKIAFKRIREMVKGIYKKEYDPSTGDFYYLNTRTGETLWEAPAAHLLGEEGSTDIELDEDSNLLLQRDKELDRLRQALSQRDAEIERVKHARFEELEEEERGKRLVSALRGQKRSRDMDEWTTEHVCAWFMEMPQMEQYCPAVVANHVDGLLLLNMEASDYEEIGVKSKLHQRRIMVAAKKYIARYEKKMNGDVNEDDDSEYSMSGSETPSELLEEEAGSEIASESEEEATSDEDDELVPTEAELLELAQDKENMVMVTKFPGNDVDFPKVGDIVRCHFQVFINDGKDMVESSRKKHHRAFEFVVGMGQVIPGWDRAVIQMSLYQRCMCTFTAKYGYGEVGYPPQIPANSPLWVDIELISFRPRTAWTKPLIQHPGLSEKPYIPPDNFDFTPNLHPEGSDGEIEAGGEGEGGEGDGGFGGWG
mmetsp:Transcript_63954/g.176637  ORF Transcript_63954/g.176637 Transcript_63954/m.176637 type:complete len:611 (-) Transcript_63954:211-2043(-)